MRRIILEIDGKFYVSRSGFCSKECVFYTPEGGPCTPYKFTRCADRNGSCIWRNLNQDDIDEIQMSLVLRSKKNVFIKISEILCYLLVGEHDRYNRESSRLETLEEVKDLIQSSRLDKSIEIINCLIAEAKGE